MNQKAQKYGIWWLILLILTIIVSIITSHDITFTGLLSSMAGHLAFTLIASLLPWGVYRLTGNPLTGEELMATITMGWLILVVANLSVM
jgi:ABC-type phosphate/phosphonate transport system permease subunit